MNEPNKLHENNNIEIPWKLAYEYNIKSEVDGLKMLIPSLELLLVYKVKALRDRTFDLHKFVKFIKNKKVWTARKEFKIQKDKRDILNLIKTGKIDFDKLEEILQKTKFKNNYEETIEELKENK